MPTGAPELHLSDLLNLQDLTQFPNLQDYLDLPLISSFDLFFDCGLKSNSILTCSLALKFMFSKKATKIDEIFTADLTLTT